jgi:hypothetical protein
VHFLVEIYIVSQAMSCSVCTRFELVMSCGIQATLLLLCDVFFCMMDHLATPRFLEHMKTAQHCAVQSAEFRPTIIDIVFHTVSIS